MKLLGKTVLLTGATGGIGREIAHVLANAGASLLLTGRSTEKLAALCAELGKRGDGVNTHDFFAADLACDAQRQQLVARAKAMNIQLLINLAGLNELSLLQDMQDQAIDSIIDMNLNSPIKLARDLLSHLSEQAEGMIINVGSIMGSIGYPGSSLYCASKFGFRGFSEALRREVSDTNLKVVYLAPRATATRMNSQVMSKMNEELGVHVDSPQYVANQLLKVIQRAHSRHYYLGWPEKLFVRINALFPWLVDNAVLKQLPIIKRYAKLNAIVEN